MSARETNKLILGSAPDSWGVWFAQDEHQVPWSKFLDELAEAGYAWLELGPHGYLPTDPAKLAYEVSARGLRVAGGTAFGALHHSHNWAKLLSGVRRVADLTAAVGAHHLVLIPAMFRHEKTGRHLEAPTLDDVGWKTLTRSANELGKILLNDYDIRLCPHPHADSHIQTQPEIERFLDDTDPRYVWLCLDTGHVAYGGGSVLDLIERYSGRIGYVHIKQIDPQVLRTVREENLSFSEAVKRGICVEPPAGEPNPAPVIDALKKLDVRLFVIVEHDLYPCEPETPLPIAVRARQYLNGCGLTASSLEER